MSAIGKESVATLAVLAVCIGRGEAAEAPTVSDVVVTDITTRSFAVTWLVSEAATGSLNLFAADCVTAAP
jgi:hypothetical protein